MTAERRTRGKSKASMALIAAAYSILEKIQPTTVRGVCYQLFVAGLIESMARNNTSRVSVQLTWAREQGLIPWAWIVDETRKAERTPSWGQPDEFAEAVSRGYRKDAWREQHTIVECWSEKGTQRGVLAPVLDAYGVTFRVMHGFSSATTVYDVASLFAQESRQVVVLYTGDWDCSGLFMSEVDLPQRLAAYGATPAKFIRAALTPRDIADRRLPSFAASEKRRDPRYRWFVDHYGHRCWELDALSPVVVRERLEALILQHIDMPAWDRSQRAEQAEVSSLRQVMRAWSEAPHA